MATAEGFRIQRLTLVAGVLTSVTAPFSNATRVVIGASGTDVVIHTNDDLSEYRTLTQGYEREFQISSYGSLAPRGFSGSGVSFWLRSTVGGLVILEWAR